MLSDSHNCPQYCSVLCNVIVMLLSWVSCLRAVINTEEIITSLTVLTIPPQISNRVCAGKTKLILLESQYWLNCLAVYQLSLLMAFDSTLNRVTPPSPARNFCICFILDDSFMDSTKYKILFRCELKKRVRMLFWEVIREMNKNFRQDKRPGG